ncbi:hypothetical protein [Actinomycetospora flava]|uniref:Ig-like domain-containing protein n=1 Tax=Actinomycetospora flava TaxID=3129232 RepID=A0ABU8M2V9_9PSEU
MPERDLHHPRDRRDHQRLTRGGAALVAAVVVALLLAGGGAATAAWLSSNAGGATARAGALTAPTATIGTISCTTSGLTTTATINVSWTKVTGATSYFVESGRLLSLAQGESKTVSGTSTTFTTTTLLLDIYVRVTAKAGNWTGPASQTVNKAVICPAGSAAPRSVPTTTTPAPAPTTTPVPTTTVPTVPTVPTTTTGPAPR